MTVAVIGAGGFIGKHVVRELIARGCTVRAVDRHLAGLATSDASIAAVEADLREVDPSSVLGPGGVDCVIHLAWGGLSNFRSAEHIEQELPAHKAFLGKLLDAGVTNLTVSGTCLEYGMREGLLKEDMVPDPVLAYAEAKDRLRAWLQDRQRNHAFNLTWCRLFYMYGAGQSPKSIYPLLKEAVTRGDQRFPMSGGNQVRDYLSVEAVAERIVSLALRRRDFGIVNVCSGSPVSIKEQVEKWLEDNSWEIDLRLGVYPYPDYEPMEFWGDTSKLEDCLK